jgi:hypothetical protein
LRARSHGVGFISSPMNSAFSRIRA